MLKVEENTYDEGILLLDIMAALNSWMIWNSFVIRERLKPFNLMTNSGVSMYSHFLVHLPTSPSTLDYFRCMIES